MRNALSRRENFDAAPRAELKSIWYVEADKTYVIDKRRYTADTMYTAVRTLTGSGYLKLFDGSEFELKANTLALFNSSDIARYAAIPDGWQFYWFEFNMNGEFAGESNRVVTQNMSAQERVELERCFTSLKSGVRMGCILADALFEYLLAEWMLGAENARLGGIGPQSITALLEKGRREKLTVSEMARSMGMCERSFRDAVVQITGLSPKAYMLKGEMTAAMELLRTSSMTISEIAACFDYASPLYFSRVFKKYYGISPQHVRDGIEL